MAPIGQALRSLLPFRKKASATHKLPYPPGQVTWLGAGKASWTARGYAALSREAYQKNVISHRCIKMVSQCVATIPVRVFRDKTLVQNSAVHKILSSPNHMQDEYEVHEKAMDKALLNATNVATIGIATLSHEVRNDGVNYKDEIESQMNNKFDKIEKSIKKELKTHGHKLGSYGKNFEAISSYISENGKTFSKRGKVFFKFIERLSTWLDLAFVYYDIIEYGKFLVRSFEKKDELLILQKNVMALAKEIQKNEENLSKLEVKLGKRGVKLNG